ncbi:MAG TPA: phospholipase D-like domain-containing protein [Methylomirabilota bacterium]|nr:phospholipase D-like domain-containing protein [Methylomirabilota bacterium]
MTARSLLLGGLLALLLGGSGCSRVQPHLELPALQVGEASFRATVVAYTGNAVVGGNRVEVLLNGDQIFPAKIAAIRAARKSVTYAQYVFEEGAPAARITEALAERCRAGIPVHVLLDAVGALAIPTEYREQMEQAGCQVVFYRPIRPWTFERANERNHRRILVVDGRVGFTGGSGTSGKWSGNGKQDGYWRDTDVRVEGPVVQQLQGAFAENWLEATGVALGGPTYFPDPVEFKGGVDAQVVRSSPAGGSAAMYTMFLLAMASARHSIYITNPYFVPDEKMIETLIQARRRGVRVVLLLPGAIDHNLVRQASRGGFGRLLKAGIEIHEYKPALLHAKTMVIDSRWSTVGSTNLDRRSFALNEELNLVIYDPGVARRLEQVFEKDLSESGVVTYERWARRGLVSRVLELLAIPVRDQM